MVMKERNLAQRLKEAEVNRPNEGRGTCTASALYIIIITGFASLLWSSLASCTLHVTRLAIQWSSYMMINAS